jgi:hypothetical protein
MGSNLRTPVCDPLGSTLADKWLQGTLFGRAGPQQRQFLSQYHHCPALSRRDARMGPKLGCHIDDHPCSPDAESQPQGTIFGGATPLAKPVKTICRLNVTATGPPARRWEDRMGPKLGSPIDNHAGTQDTKSRPERRGGVPCLNIQGCISGYVWIFMNGY